MFLSQEEQLRPYGKSIYDLTSVLWQSLLNTEFHQAVTNAKAKNSFTRNHPYHKLPNCSLSPTPGFSSHLWYPLRTHEVGNSKETIRTLTLPTCCTLHRHGQESSGQLPVSDESRINMIPCTSGRGCNYRLGKHSSKIPILSQCSKCLYFDLCYTS